MRIYVLFQYTTTEKNRKEISEMYQVIYLFCYHKVVIIPASIGKLPFQDAVSQPKRQVVRGRGAKVGSRLADRCHAG